mgnify:CR=1 FL=1
MKLLFDQNLSHRLPSALLDIFPGSSQVRLVGLDQSDDTMIWDYAGKEGFCIVTLDADFAELSECMARYVNRDDIPCSREGHGVKGPGGGANAANCAQTLFTNRGFRFCMASPAAA